MNVLVIAEQCLYSIKAFSPPQLPTVSMLVEDKRLGGDIAKSADPNWPKGYSIPYDVVLSNNSSEKWGGKRDVRSYGICLPKQLLCMLRPCHTGRGWTSASQWIVVYEFFFLLCLHARLLLSLFNCHYLSSWVFSTSFCFHPGPQDKRLSERPDGCLAVGWAQATRAV